MKFNHELFNMFLKTLKINNIVSIDAYDLEVDDIAQDIHGNDYIIVNIIVNNNSEKVWVLFSDNSYLDTEPIFDITNLTLRPKNLEPKKCKEGTPKPRGRPKKVKDHNKS